MRENYTLTRLHVESPLSQGKEIELSKEQAHYLRNVLRKGEGDVVRVFNSQAGEWRAEIAELSKRAVKLTINDQTREPKPCPDITLCFAPVRKHRIAFIVEKATELGVRVLQPIITARTQFPKFNTDKARFQAIEAAEQTERLDIPEIAEPQKLMQMIEGWDDRTLIFADEAGEALPALSALKDVSGPVSFLVGPEGGFTPQERKLLREQSFVKPVSLGPRILRADTAALSLLTLWQAVQGDWL